MNKLTNFLRKSRLGQILTVFISGLLLFVSTACNSGTMTGARPDNPPVQAGGMNNPHKAGGDGYTNYKMSTDPHVQPSATKSGQNRADASMNDNRSLASTDSNASRLLYPGSAPMETDKYDQELGGDKELLEKPGKYPNQRQPIVNRNDPDAQILERVGAAFKDASSFLNDSTQEGVEKTFTKGTPLQK